MVFLIADDDSDDHDFFRETAEEVVGGNCSIIPVFNGQQAINYLLGQHEYLREVTVRPDVIILDLNMPKLNGIDTLKAIKGLTAFSQIPVYVLTTSWEEKYMNECRVLGAAGYFIKPSEMKVLNTIIRQIVAETQRGQQKPGPLNSTIL